MFDFGSNRKTTLIREYVTRAKLLLFLFSSMNQQTPLLSFFVSGEKAFAFDFTSHFLNEPMIFETAITQKKSENLILKSYVEFEYFRKKISRKFGLSVISILNKTFFSIRMAFKLISILSENVIQLKAVELCLSYTTHFMFSIIEYIIIWAQPKKFYRHSFPTQNNLYIRLQLGWSIIKIIFDSFFFFLIYVMCSTFMCVLLQITSQFNAMKVFA